MKFMLGAAAILGGLFLWTGPVAAHHALQAQFDTNKVLSLKGELARVEWINPHAYFWFDVKDETGKVTQWGAETVGPPDSRRASAVTPGSVLPVSSVTFPVILPVGACANDGEESARSVTAKDAAIALPSMTIIPSLVVRVLLFADGNTKETKQKTGPACAGPLS